MKLIKAITTIGFCMVLVACSGQDSAATEKSANTEKDPNAEQAAGSATKSGSRSAATPPAFVANGVTYIGSRNSAAAVDAFLGVPFAQPPVGELRWMPPQPLRTQSLAAAHESTSAAKTRAQEFAAACMQGPHMVKWYKGVITSFGGDPETFPEPQISEDCLYLNIWRPQPVSPAENAGLLPVMVFIHGGSNKGGWSFEPNYIGEQLARRGVIVVTVAYRVAGFGFLAHPALEQTNFALLDQIAALRWIQDNIAALGGDPAKVTVSGESAGANDIEFLMASPLAAGLFQAVIHQSAGSSQLDRTDTEKSVELGRQLAVKVLGRQNADNIGELRKVPAQTILDAVAEIYDGHYFDPVVDGVSVTMPLGEAVAQGKIAKVDLLIGTNADEWTIYLDPAETVDAWLGKNLAEKDALVARHLLDNDDIYKNEGPAKHLDRLITAQNFVCPSLKLATAVSAAGGQSWVYYFSKVRAGELAATMGAYHGAELPYVFNTHDHWLPTDAADHALTESVMNYWVQFVKSGNPNIAGMPAWPAYAKQNDPVQVLDTEIKSEPHSSQPLCEILMPL